MKRYPKVPRHDHGFVKQEWFDSDTYILEKYDGSNLRFMLYDDRYSEYYDIDATHGELIIGSKKVYKPASKVDELDATLKLEDRLEHIRQSVEKDKLFELHEYMNGPVVFYGENMIEHTLEYEWDETPKVILFDLYAPSEDTDLSSTPDHPYNETFTGFLDWISLVRIVNYVTELPTAACIGQGIDFENVSQDMFKESEYRNGKPEGYIFRNDTHKRRVKIRTEEFKELNKYIWGRIEEENPPASKKIAYVYTGQQRVKEKVLEVYSGTASEDVLEKSVPILVEDIWEEEWNEFCDHEFTPSELYMYVAERVKATMLRPNLFGVPTEFKNIAENWSYSGEYTPDTIEPTDTKQYLLSLVTDSVLSELYTDVLRESDKEEGNWMIQPLAEKVRLHIWYTNRDTILRINTSVPCHEINESIYDIVVPFVKNN